MSYSDLIRNMIAEGATPQLILLAVEAIEARDNAAAEAREKAAERKRRQRAKERDVDVTVVGQSQDSHGDSPDATPFPAPPNENNLTPPTHTPENNTHARVRADPFPMPDGADPAVWRDFLKNRKTKRLPNTATAHSRFLADLQREVARTGWPPGEVLRRCTERGWGAIYQIDEGPRHAKPTHKSGSVTQSAYDLAMQLTGGHP